MMVESEVSANMQKYSSGKVQSQRNLKCDQTINKAKAEFFPPFTAKGSTAQMVPEVGNLMHVSKAALVPNSYERVKIV